MHEDTIEKLRGKIKELKEELEKVTFEKGLIAEENKDLRENSAYDYWDQKETNLIIRIHRIIKEISDGSKKENPTVKPNRAKKDTEKKQFDIRPHKWL